MSEPVYHCTGCGKPAVAVIEETDDERLDAVVTCPNCGQFIIQGLDDHEDFPLGG
jgi:DNA-directed RNA polymerase subunit RPC12/RpoP